MAHSSSIATIFKRGGQKPEFAAATTAEDGDADDVSGQQLEQHLQQLAVAWAAPKVRKGVAAAVWRPAVGAFEVVERGRQTFNGQGFMYNKRLYLNIEEAVYLLDRAVAILLIEHDTQQQQQQQQQHVEQRLLSMQEVLHMMAVLGVAPTKLSVLSHLSRLGFLVRRHPVCWQVPPNIPACSTWQVNPAWAHTDGLLPPGQQPLLQALPAASCPATKTSEPVQQQEVASEATRAAAAAAAAGSSPEQQAKRRKLEQGTVQQQQQQQQQDKPGPELGGPQPPQQQQQQGTAVTSPSEGQAPKSQHWYTGLPSWLQQDQQQQDQQQQQEQQQQGLVSPLLGEQLRQQFPLLQPLARYRDRVQGGDTPQQQLQQQQQQLTASSSSSVCTAEVVFDVLPVQPRFSYKQPPAPEFSIAMMTPGATTLPPLDEILDLSVAVAAAPRGGAPHHTQASALAAAAAAAAAAGAAAAGAAAAAADGHGSLGCPGATDGAQKEPDQGHRGQAAAAVCAPASGSSNGGGCGGSNGSNGGSNGGSSGQPVRYSAVKFALPEEGDVSFCELVPLRLMDFLTNK